MNNSDNASTEIISNFMVPVSVERAFDVFTQELSSWWPKEYTWAGDVLETIEIEPHENGRCFERGPYGFECDWGRVLHWKPPTKILFTWQIAPDRVPVPNADKASVIEVNFEQKESETTQVQFHHRNFDRHGENAATYKEALDSPQGWPYILNCYKEVVEK